MNAFLRRFALLGLFFLPAFAFLRFTDYGNRVNAWANLRVARSTAAVLRASGRDAVALGAEIHTAGYAVTIVDECNGLFAATLLSAAALSAPASWSWRAAGAFAAWVFVAVTNVLRLWVVMEYGSRHSADVELLERTWIRAAHWVFALAVFWIWLRAGRRSAHER